MIHHRRTRQQQEHSHGVSDAVNGGKERKVRDEEVTNQGDQLRNQPRHHKTTTTTQEEEEEGGGQEAATSLFGWYRGCIRRMRSKASIFSILVVVVVVAVSVSRPYPQPTLEEARQLLSFTKNEQRIKHPRSFVNKTLEDMVDRMIQLSSSESTTKADTPPQQHSTEYRNQGDLNNNNTMNNPSSLLSSSPRCALNFYGLPRAFSRIVLPSIVRNILIPNARYQCDIYVYFHALAQEASGRSGHGGSLDLDSVHLIRQAVHRVHEKFQQQQQPLTHKRQPSSTGSPPPRVVIANYTSAEIERQRDALLTKIRTTVHPKTNRSVYVPWTEGFTLDTIYNVVRMWHAIEGVWDLMMMRTTTAEATIHPYYQRVAMFRIDVFYATPIDIFHYNSNRSTPLLSSSGNDVKNDINNRNLSHPTSTMIHGRIYDVDNRVAVIPGFARYPVNDRMMYGPFDALQVYATRRFDLMPHLREHHGLDELHPETFLERVVFPEILKLNEANSTRTSSSSQPRQRQRPSLSIYEDDSICFVRARADESVWINDCIQARAEAGRKGRKKNAVILKGTLTQLQRVVGGRCTTQHLKPQISPNITAAAGVLQATCQ